MNITPSDDQHRPSITVGDVFAEAVWLLSQSPQHRHNFFLADLEWLLMPPISQGQFRVFKADGKPFALALWAFVSSEVEQRLARGHSKLKWDEWRSGEQPWLVDLAAPFGQADKVLGALQTSVFKKTGFHCLQVNAEGQRDTVFYPGKSEGASPPKDETGA